MSRLGLLVPSAYALLHRHNQLACCRDVKSAVCEKHGQVDVVKRLAWFVQSLSQQRRDGLKPHICIPTKLWQTPGITLLSPSKWYVYVSVICFAVRSSIAGIFNLNSAVRGSRLAMLHVQTTRGSRVRRDHQS